MNLAVLPRWVALASLAAFLVLVFAPAQALTDTNAELKEAAAHRAPGVGSAKARPAKPLQTAIWVPVSPKRLDGFRPVLPPERDAALLARAEAKPLRSGQ